MSRCSSSRCWSRREFFLADQPGRVEIVWQDWQIETSVGVLLAAALLAFFVLWALIAGLRALWHMPRTLRRAARRRRRRVGERALTRGLIALAAGEGAEAARHARRAERLLGQAPLPLLLTAQTAELNRDQAAARLAYSEMAEHPELALVGLRGLLQQAMRTGDDAAALQLAQRARLLRPKSAWLTETFIMLETRTGDWQAAEATLTDAARQGLIPRAVARRQRGALLYEQSRAAERDGDLSRALNLAEKAQARRPDVPATTCQRARLLLALGNKRAAAKIVERAWRGAPHPELAKAYAMIHGDDPPLARAAAFERLTLANPNSSETDLAIAEAALTAQLWGEARRHLARAAGAGTPSRRVCLLMARLEEGEHGNTEEARNWLTRAATTPSDGCYLCANCKGESTEWHALCPHCSALDTLAWGEPSSGSRELAVTAPLTGVPGRAESANPE